MELTYVGFLRRQWQTLRTCTENKGISKIKKVKRAKKALLSNKKDESWKKRQISRKRNEIFIFTSMVDKIL